MLITVFTPVYNRAYCIEKLYDSLCHQTCKSFEWVVVDDGSTDNVADKINSFIAQNKINIRFVRQENGGKHTAINRGVDMAQGELFFIVDSDDHLSQNAIELITLMAAPIMTDRKFAGVAGLRMHTDGTPISRGLSSQTLDATSLNLRYQHHIHGDLAEVIKTDVMRTFRFPVFENERFTPEALVWNRIAARGLKLRLFNKGIYIGEYLPDGLTAGIVKARMNSPLATTMCYSELTSMSIPLIQKIKAAINYWRFWLCSSASAKPKISPLWIWALPLGAAMHLRDLKNTK